MFVSYFPYPTGNRAATSFGPSLHLLSLLCSDFSLQLTLWLFSFYYDALRLNRNSHHFETYLQEEKNKCGFAIWDDQFLKKNCVRRLAVELDKIRQDKTRQDKRLEEMRKIFSFLLFILHTHTLDSSDQKHYLHAWNICAIQLGDFGLGTAFGTPYRL